jgi:preprotein translocase subunit SecA
MIMVSFLNKLFDTNARELKRLKPMVETINALEERTQSLSDGELGEKTDEFKLRLERGETLDDLVPEAFAVVREASRRVNGERPYDVQLMAAIVLHEGKVAEQKTGEGKTLSAVPALYLNALTGRGVHLVTVNDYLARRDCGWMGRIFHLLGLSTAAIMNDASFVYDPEYVDETTADWRLRHLRPVSRREAYRADVTYGVNSEFGFDYLRDNMATDPAQLVQRDYHFAVVDEVDSILIDEARTPHIISTPDVEPADKYYQAAELVKKLNPETDFEVDEKLKAAYLTERGIMKLEKQLGVSNLYEEDFETLHHVENALKARTLFRRDRDYVIKDNEVILVDEFTGRLMFGRRYSEGLHQAIEAKEGVPIKQESKTVATISLQNYFRMYEKLAGMTGTAATEMEEFEQIYGLGVVVIPTHRPMIRKRMGDLVYVNQKAKFTAVANEIAARHRKGQPVLVGTTSIEKNELIGRLLSHKKIPHQLLNAKNHEKEAAIIAKAGEKGAVTVATNIAGRGVDIILGGEPPKDDKGMTKVGTKAYEAWKKANEEVKSLGGLHVIGTERHESRRIDNQLRGRSGRQGDPGSSQFFVSLEDDIMRLFGGDQVKRLMTRFNLPDHVPLEHRMVSKAIEQAQVKVEGFYFDQRKRVVEFDDVMNKQREIIYRLRRRVLEFGQETAGDEDKEWLRQRIWRAIEREIASMVSLRSPEGFSEEELEMIVLEVSRLIPLEKGSQKQLLRQLKKLSDPEEIEEFLGDVIRRAYETKEKEVGEKQMLEIERLVMLRTIDELWMDHLDAMNDLREGIWLRGGPDQVLAEYKKEAFGMFERLVSAIDYQTAQYIFRVQVGAAPPAAVAPPRLVAAGGDLAAMAAQPLAAANPHPFPGAGENYLSTRQLAAKDPSLSVDTEGTVRRKGHKVGRNDPCPCGSGKKYKKCHYPAYG